jgi:hypothetical protein
MRHHLPSQLFTLRHPAWSARIPGQANVNQAANAS